MPSYWCPRLNRHRATMFHASTKFRSWLQGALAGAEADAEIDSDVLEETRSICTGGYDDATTTMVLLHLTKVFLGEASTTSGDRGCCPKWCCGGCCSSSCCHPKKRTEAVSGLASRTVLTIS